MKSIRKPGPAARPKTHRCAVRIGVAWPWSVLAGVLMLVQSTVFGQPLPANAGAGSAQPMDLPGTVLAGAAMRAGVRRCYPMINAVSGRTFANAEHTDVVLDWDRTNPDGEPFFSLSGLDYGQASALLSLTTAPADTGCTVLAERISSAPLPCKDVARSELAGYRASPLVKSVTVYTNPARPRETVTLLDAPPSCVIVRRQVHYGSRGVGMQ
ncbi:hypothetical protein KY49_7012 [Burkholderia sp. MSHR3999]|uniref:hypothetical protein n=1 Tax=Burkholderia sp. MSHR3999 TaxID=1542965 RepID=UPI0005B70253|nr:hypothetical protein [Burkholderia sp. MSHR3999]KIP17341.1 hypothetical protein KY49_7012 [Burkholderia sp. MSHR3999]